MLTISCAGMIIAYPKLSSALTYLHRTPCRLHERSYALRCLLTLLQIVQRGDGCQRRMTQRSLGDGRKQRKRERNAPRDVPFPAFDFLTFTCGWMASE